MVLNTAMKLFSDDTRCDMCQENNKEVKMRESSELEGTVCVTLGSLTIILSLHNLFLFCF